MIDALVVAQTATPVTGAGLHFDWTIPIGTAVLVIGQFVAGIVAIMRVMASVEKAIEKRFTEIALTLNTFKEGDIRELQGRLVRLETGADEWTKALRERSHAHANDINVMKMEIDRLKRPSRWPQDPASGD